MKQVENAIQRALLRVRDAYDEIEHEQATGHWSDQPELKSVKLKVGQALIRLVDARDEIHAVIEEYTK
jgi:hypothetical protein